MEDKITTDFSRASSGETKDEEMSGKGGRSRQRRAAIMADKILVWLPSFHSSVCKWILNSKASIFR